MKSAGGDKNKAMRCRPRRLALPRTPHPEAAAGAEEPSGRAWGGRLPAPLARAALSPRAAPLPAARAPSPHPTPAPFLTLGANSPSGGSRKGGAAGMLHILFSLKRHGLRALPFSSSSPSFLQGFHLGDARFRCSEGTGRLTASLHIGLTVPGQRSCCTQAVQGILSMDTMRWPVPKQWSQDVCSTRAVGHLNGPEQNAQGNIKQSSPQCYRREYGKGVRSWRCELQLRLA